MVDLVTESPAVPAAAQPTPASAPAATYAEIGLALAFGAVFVFGAAAWVAELFGAEPGAGFAQALLLAQAASIGALIGFVLIWEGLPLESLGIRRPARIDLEFGFALFILLLVLELAIGSLVPILYESEIAFLTNSLWLPIPTLLPLAAQLPRLTGAALIVVMVLGEELAARGYAFTRLERLTQSTLLSAALALLIDLFAHAPLWGLDYAICILPAEIILMWLYVSERRLAPCVASHLLLDLLPLILIALHIQLLARPQPPPDPHVQRGSELMQQHDYAGAIAEFGKALEQDADNAFAYRMRGDAHALHGDVDAAIADFNEAIRRDPERPGLYVNRSYAYRLKRDLPHALADINSAIKLDPSNSNWLYRRGYIYSLMGDRDKAIADAGAAIAIDPVQPDYYQLRAEEYQKKGEHEKALADADNLLRLRPSFAYGYSLRANIELALHQADKAIADARKTLELEPDDMQTAYWIAGMYRTLGRWDDELSFCEKQARQHPREGNLHACAAEAYYHKGDVKGAIGAMDDAVAAQPDAPALYSQRAWLEIAAGQPKQAQADVKKIAEVQPHDAQANNNAAWILSTNPDPGVRDAQVAIALAKKACQLSSWNNAQSLDTLAAAYANSGDFTQAVNWQQYALKVAAASRSEVLLEGMRARLALYQRHEPYREPLR
jgi:tetratricopeptide (TPR) repeat protein/membrane protease YdiL (CAAX protease family)